MFIEILFKILLFKGDVLIYAEHCIYVCVYVFVCVCRGVASRGKRVTQCIGPRDRLAIGNTGTFHSSI